MYRRLFRSISFAIALLAWAGVPVTAADKPACAVGPLKLASFNIQFLGSSAKRDNEGLADLVGDQDIVLVQELIAPPFAGSFPPNPDGTVEPFKPDPQAAAFFEAMRSRGFSWVMSEEDTGTGDRIHLNSTATEWWVAFYKPQAAAPANDLPGGFLASDRSNHPDYERVPFAFPFRNCSGTMDFVLVSVHLQPDDGPAPRQRRQHEIASISQWIDAQAGNGERDYLIVGDTNIQDCGELAQALPPGYQSLNASCIATNTNVKGPKPYDHVFYRPAATAPEIDQAFGFKVVGLVDAMRNRWQQFGTGPYPGDPYRHDDFRQVYSDHSPVLFRMVAAGRDDD